MKARLLVLTTILGVLLAPGRAGFADPVITAVGIPEDSIDAGGHPVTDDVWRVSVPPPYPLDTSTGVGYLLNPSESNDYSLHDHVYAAPHVPDPNRAVVTYEFSEPAVVDQIEIVQHTNGITQIEGLVGNSVGSLVSIGSV
jgi:hypothetical protein